MIQNFRVNFVVQSGIICISYTNDDITTFKAETLKTAIHSKQILFKYSNNKTTKLFQIFYLGSLAFSTFLYDLTTYHQ